MRLLKAFGLACAMMVGVVAGVVAVFGLMVLVADLAGSVYAGWLVVAAAALGLLTAAIYVLGG